MKRDSHRQALERYDDAREYMRENYARMREDLRFSNPANPEQWDKPALELRKGRPCLTFDRTNQFVMQVVNTGRQNKPSIVCLPADDVADPEVAEKLNGVVRHIEYVSRASVAYDTALEHAARVGLGWMRAVPEVLNPEANEQDVRIKKVADPLSVHLEAGWQEPDGSDAMHGFVETLVPKKVFEAQYPKAATQSWDTGSTGWFDDRFVRVCEYFCVEEEPITSIRVQMEGQSLTLTEDEYWALVQQTGVKFPYEVVEGKKRRVAWKKLSGAEVLEETDFPSQYLPLIPVVGHDLMIDGKRHLSGMTRRLMDSQRAYNYERSAFIESVAMQPKAPFLTPREAIEGFEQDWANLNAANPAYLPYNAYDEGGNPIPAPSRLAPPPLPVAFAQGGQIASQDMEASIGMFRANLGAPGAAVSGRAKREDKLQGDTANFHYTDNLAVSIGRLGRVVVDMIPRVYDTQRQARILGEDGEQSFVNVDPSMGEPVQKRGKEVVAINPGVGRYDVRVKTGPAYTTLRQETAEQLSLLLQAAPQLMPLLGDVWVRMQDWPEADKIARRLKATLPPEIAAAEEDDDAQIPPAAMAQMQAMQQQMAQLSQALENAAAEVERLEAQQNDKARAEAIRAETQIEVAHINADKARDVEEIKGMVAQLMALMQPAPQFVESASEPSGAKTQ